MYRILVRKTGKNLIDRKEFDRLPPRLKRKFVKEIIWAEQGLVMSHYERKIYRIVIILLFCVDMQHVFSLWGKNVVWRCSRRGCCRGRYLGPSGESNRTLQKIAFLDFTSQQILLRNQIKYNEIGRARGTYGKTRTAVLMEKT